MRYTEDMVPEWLCEAQRVIRIDGEVEGENMMFGATIEDEETIMNRILEQRYGEVAYLDEDDLEDDEMDDLDDLDDEDDDFDEDDEDFDDEDDDLDDDDEDEDW